MRSVTRRELLMKAEIAGLGKHRDTFERYYPVHRT